MISVTTNAPGSARELPIEILDRKFPGLIDDLISRVIERDPTRFLNAHGVPVDGAEQSFIGFKFDWPKFKLAFDDELFTASRTLSVELPRGKRFVSHGVSLPDHGSHVIGCRTMASIKDALVNISDQERKTMLSLLHMQPEQQKASPRPPTAKGDAQRKRRDAERQRPTSATSCD